MEPVTMVCAATAIYGGLRGLAALGRQRRTARRHDDVLLALLDARGAAADPLAWRLACSGDDLSALDCAHTDDRALSRNGFHRLGEIVALGKLRTVVRGYADDAATTVAIVLVAGGQAHLDLRSFATTGVRYTSTRGARARLASPAQIRVIEHAPEVTVQNLIAQHRAWIAAEATPLVMLATPEALLAQVAANHDSTRAWRDAQPPEDLLDADLRALLRGQYPRLGALWLRRLRSRIPSAVVRRDRPIGISRS